MTGAVGVLIPYSILTFTFDYPGILRKETSEILVQFHEGGSALIFTWLAFALLGSPLIAAYALMGDRLNSTSRFMKLMTGVGMLSGILQVIGLLRWVFVVPMLARDFVNAASPAKQEAIIAGFNLIHQFAGVLLGEHLGQLLTILWTLHMTTVLSKTKLISRRVAYLGYAGSFVYLLAQAELIATVIPGFPVFEFSGLAGSLLWLLWIVIVGSKFYRLQEKHQPGDRLLNQSEFSFRLPLPPDEEIEKVAACQ